MSSKCICHPDNAEQAIGYICENCLALHCFEPQMKQLKEVHEGTRTKAPQGKTWEKIQKLDDNETHR